MAVIAGFGGGNCGRFCQLRGSARFDLAAHLSYFVVKASGGFVSSFAALLVRTPAVIAVWATLGLSSLVFAQAQGNYEGTLAKADSLVKQQKFKEAAAIAEQAIQVDQTRWEAYYTAASAYSGQQFFDDAIGMLQIALARAPQEKKQAIRAALADARRGSVNPPQTPSTAASASALPSDAEMLLWKGIENSKNPDDYRGYLKSFPTGIFADVSANRIDTLDWQSVENSSKTGDLERYLSLHPAGTYASSARSRLTALRTQQEAASKETARTRGETFEWKHDHGGLHRPAGKLHVEKDLISWKEDLTQKGADGSHNFSTSCAGLKWEEGRTRSYNVPFIEFSVNGRRIRLFYTGNEGKAFLAYLKDSCTY